MDKFRIVLDPGHGGHDFGAVGKFSNEKDINLSVAKMLSEKLFGNPDVEVFMTRDSDTFKSLEFRGLFAKNVEANMFISIHCNASENKKAHDTQVYYFSDHSLYLSGIVFNMIDNIDGYTSKWSGVKFGNFKVLRDASELNIPAILIELKFISNEKDEKELNDYDFQNTIASKIYDAILFFLSQR